MSVPPVVTYCRSCQKKIPVGASFCASCGTAIKAAPSSSTGNKSLISAIVGGICIVVSVGAALTSGIFGLKPGSPVVGVSIASNAGPSQPISTPIPTPTPIPNPEDAEPILRAPLDEFGKRYDENKIFVKSTYGGKFIGLQGQVEDISGDMQTGKVRLRGLSTMAAVTCIFNHRTTIGIAKLRKGSVIVIRGYFTGGETSFVGSDSLEMTDCKIEE